MTLDLFEGLEESALPAMQPLAAGAVLLRGFALAQGAQLLAGVEAVLAQAPLRHLITPGGFRMSVAMSNCGALGWVSDLSGYRYDASDPDSGRPWPPMPAAFRELAAAAARAGGFEGFAPDACLINRYEAGTRLSLHQDRDEGNYDWPIVSVSLGLPAVFLFGGPKRSDKAQRVPLTHGDVVVWGGASRLHYHGVLPVKEGEHPLTGACRINLTFRKAR
ncbi:DNA oxidative demethylase AlkB [Variovorax sp. WS11]|uniref:DNA oxidative demethylase AlkB n=1 Tax=Variovorax sp. WS11 TaxID=1105204 RepID=UPI000D0DE775|nr:DNA oxidative demethylase AlkB [Variovorax sp. WS11]NDZ16682.1 DNA oxidative demethylase AlkB [Variovorax sp. WS11]PSL79785.1 DNA oxidative demethylase AlkB [Variovorax sp. WS11]